MPKSKINQKREEKLKINRASINSITNLLYICDVFSASRTMADLMEHITSDEKEGFVSAKEAEDIKLDAHRLFTNAEKRCKCFYMPDIF